MPELPEVQMVVQTLRPGATGRRIDLVRLLRADMVHPQNFDLAGVLSGRTIAEISRRGKKIVFRLDDGNGFYIHLGMTGRLTATIPDAPLQRHTHLILEIGIQHIRLVDPRRFGGIFWLGTKVSADDGLGPEPLTMTSRQLSDRLARTHRAIKSALLDQTLVAGLGNIYVDESLFDAKIHPLTFSDRLTKLQVAALSRSIKKVLRRALRHRGSTLRDYRDANGQSGDFQKLHRVYDRTGQPCLICKTKIARLVIGGRSSHFCPKCQPKSQRDPR